jgi:hypothetical protein
MTTKTTKTKTRTRTPRKPRRGLLASTAVELGTGPLQWVKEAIDCYGYDWGFEGRYAISSTGQVVSFVGKKPRKLRHVVRHGYPSVSLRSHGETLNIAVSQLTRQVWGEEVRLARHNCIRKNRKPGDVSVFNLQQATHWAHVVGGKRNPRAGAWSLLTK